MTFLEFIERSFKRVLSVDTEFRLDLTGTVPEKVVCFVYKDIFTGETFRFWEHNLEISPLHFNYDDCLLVSFSAVAEYGCYLKQLHGKPKNMWDCFVENKRLYGPFREKGKFGLIDTCGFYGVECMSKDEKDSNINLIVNNQTYTFEQQRKILKYCQRDVEENAELFIAQVQDIEEKQKLRSVEDYQRELWQIMFRGYAQGCVAHVEKFGIPVDINLISEFNKYWPEVKDEIIKRWNKNLGVYNDDLSFSNLKFTDFIKRCGLQHKWPMLKSGFFTTNDKVVKKFEDHPLIKEFRQLKKLLNTTKLSSYEPCADGRVRTSLFMYGTITSRCTPSSSKYPLGASKWARNFISAPCGMRTFSIDYVAQEPAIQGYLSGDKNLIENYQTGDIYIRTGQSLGIIKDPSATKSSHEKERDVVKILFLANTYGQGAPAIAKTLGITLFRAKDLLIKFEKLYKTYLNWINGSIDGAYLAGNLTTPLGWQRWIKGNKKWKDGKLVSIKNQLKNFPIQATGGDVLRTALIDLIDEHFEVNALLHDAIIISVPNHEAQERLEKAKEIMLNASMKVVNGPIRVDHEEIGRNWKQKIKHQEIFDEIFFEIRKYKSIKETTRDLRVGVLAST